MATTSVNVKDTFASIFEVTDVKTQRNALRGSMRSEARNVKEIAKGYIRSIAKGKKGRSLSQATSGIENGIYERVYPAKYGSGFMVSVIPHGRKGYHINRQGLEKPVLMWAETGTRKRHRGPRKGSVKSWSRLTGTMTRKYDRTGAYTGFMPEYGFLEKAEKAAASGVENRLFSKFEDNLERAARRKGLL